MIVFVLVLLVVLLLLIIIHIIRRSMIINCIIRITHNNLRMNVRSGVIILIVHNSLIIVTTIVHMIAITSIVRDLCIIMSDSITGNRIRYRKHNSVCVIRSRIRSNCCGILVITNIVA